MAGGNERVLIVTGGGTGIGRATALHMAKLGWRVAVNYSKSRDEAEATAADCRDAGGDGFAVEGNVAEDAACRRIAADTLARWGRIDGLVNNAGVTAFRSPDDLDALTAEDFARIFSVNVTGAYQMARAVADAMRTVAREPRDGPGPGIVNVSSHGAFTGLGSSMAYASSKGALNTLTLALARSLAPLIRVNAVCPGFVDTDWVRRGMNDSTFENFRKRVVKISPLGEITRPEDVAEAVAWFLTCGRTVTGQLLVLDAGVHLTIRTPLSG
jgi:3-oxoacyl-[acyl-carrier protein] reductase